MFSFDIKWAYRFDAPSGTRREALSSSIELIVPKGSFYRGFYIWILTNMHCRELTRTVTAIVGIGEASPSDVKPDPDMLVGDIRPESEKKLFPSWINRLNVHRSLRYDFVFLLITFLLLPSFSFLPSTPALGRFGWRQLLEASKNSSSFKANRSTQTRQGASTVDLRVIAWVCRVGSVGAHDNDDDGEDGAWRAFQTPKYTKKGRTDK
nr:hypothetical transcript [Hymenolepis microstoma]